MDIQLLSYIYMALFLIFYLVIGIVMTSEPHAGMFGLSSIVWFVAVSYSIFFGIATGLYAFAVLGIAQIVVSFGVFIISALRRSS